MYTFEMVPVLPCQTKIKGLSNSFFQTEVPTTRKIEKKASPTDILARFKSANAIHKCKHLLNSMSSSVFH